MFDLILIHICSSLHSPHLAEGKLTDIKVVARRLLGSKDLVPYPTSTMPFFLYGSETQKHIDHVYTASPNIQMSADQVKVVGLVNDWSERPLVYAHLPFPESAMHPFPQGRHLESNTPLPYRFRAGEKFDKVKFTSDLEGKVQLGSGTITLSEEKTYIDTDMLNEAPGLPGSTQAKITSAVDRNNFYHGIVVSSYHTTNTRLEADTCSF